MRVSFGLLLGIVLVVVTAPGCGPSLTEDDLGTVVFDASQLPGADEPYAMPETHAPPASDPESGSAGQP